MRYLFTLLLLLMPIVSSADIYKQIDKNGNVTYSDVPLGNNSVKIVAPETNTAPASSGQSNPTNPQTEPSVQTSDIMNQLAVPTIKPYTTFLIVSPTDQETIQNQPVITINIKLDPPLQQGDSIQVYLDGNAWGVPQTTNQITLPAPDRGTHEISAQLFDRNMQVLKTSNTNTIYIHQAHLGS